MKETDFRWGVATSAYQIEGASSADGKGPSIWDAFSRIPGKIKNGDTGDSACDHYHRFKEDISLMKDMGVNSYRMSISWSRIYPAGRGKQNQGGIDFYNRVFDELAAAGIEAWATLYHWDLPLALQFECDGWLGSGTVDAFERYAKTCFESFGDRVKNWITINEPWVICVHSHGVGMDAPGRTSLSEPYLVGHNLLRAHSRAVHVYRKEFKSGQKGQIGITLNCDWREPATQNPSDIEAARRAVQFMLGWFADPIYFGDYPEEMRARLKERLPAFTSEEKAFIRHSNDFFGLNHYSTMLAADDSSRESTSVHDDAGVRLSFDPSWPLTDMGWSVAPEGFLSLLRWIHDRYRAPQIFVTENGCAVQESTKEMALNDTFRKDFLRKYIGAALEAKSAGVNLGGYFAWSLLDNFEWASGFDKRFGLCHVDYASLERTLKNSARWYSQLIRARSEEERLALLGTP